MLALTVLSPHIRFHHHTSVPVDIHHRGARYQKSSEASTKSLTYLPETQTPEPPVYARRSSGRGEPIKSLPGSKGSLSQDVPSKWCRLYSGSWLM